MDGEWRQKEKRMRSWPARQECGHQLDMEGQAGTTDRRGWFCWHSRVAVIKGKASRVRMYIILLIYDAGHPSKHCF
eukprot:scaffold26656_cov149-Skeletonema_menzelii.AAC.2